MASYLARERSTNEPEASCIRAADLKHLLREIEAFQLDHGSEMGFDHEIKGFRNALERLLRHPQTSVVPPGQAGATSSSGVGALDLEAGLTGTG